MVKMRGCSNYMYFVQTIPAVCEWKWCYISESYTRDQIKKQVSVLRLTCSNSLYHLASLNRPAGSLECRVKASPQYEQ